MKTKYIAIIASATLTTFIAGCGGGSEEQAETGTSTDVMGMTDSSTTGENLTAYPLDTCIISGEKLGSMGDPVLASFQGQEFKLCCKDCLKEFNEDKDAYMTKLMAMQTAPDTEAVESDHSDHEHGEEE